MAIPIEFLLTKCASSAADIERNDYVVAYFQVFHTRANFLNDSDEFMPESGTDSCIGHKSVV
jgi:hypothetical protein